jgi:LuxR family transcriptional regulator, maltose regulon positive regulatory protein
MTHLYESKEIVRKKLLARPDISNPPRIFLIQAPSGYGKTVLAGQLAAHLGKPVIWQSINTWQRDIVTLTRQVADDITIAFGLEDYDRNTIPTSAAAAAHFLLELLAQKKNWIYILDDVHNLLNHPAVVTWLQTLLDHTPDGCFILVGQQLPSVNLLPYIAQSQVIGYGLEDLKFSQEETKELLVQYNLPKTIDPTELVQQFDGWIAGIRMALQPLPEDLASSLYQRATPEEVFQQLAEKLFRSQSPDMQEFLLQTAVLENFRLADCHQILKIPYAQKHLEQAFEQNLFLAKQGKTYHYHALFQEFLRKKFKQVSEVRYLNLEAQIADYYAEQGDDATAVMHLIAGRETLKAAAIAERIAVSYHVQGKWQTLQKFIRCLSDETVNAPTLWLMGAIIETDNYQFASAQELLLRAEAEYKTMQDCEGLARIQAQRAFLAVRQGKLLEGLQLCEALLQERNLPTAILAWVHRVQGIAYIDMGEYENAIDALEMAYKFAQDKNYLAMILQDLSSAYFFTGRMDTASQVLQDLVALRRQLKEPFYLALALNNLGCHYHHCSDYKSAQSCFEEGLSILAAFNHHRTQAYLLWSMGDLHRDCGRWQAAEQSYQAALQANVEQDISLQASILLSLAHLRIWQQRWEDALPILRDAEQYIADAPHKLLLKTISILRTIVYGTVNSEPETQLFADLQRDVEDIHRANASINLSQVLGLYFWFGLQHSNDGILQHAEQLLCELHEQAPLQAFAADLRHIPQLGYYFEARKSELPAMQEAIQALRQEIAIPQHDSQEKLAVACVEIQSLGDFQLLLDGRPIPQRIWAASTARELFLYLYFQGSQRREHLALLFWPDMTASKVRSNFHTTLYRAREALGENIICFEEDRYFINPELEITCDAYRMRQMIEQARALSPRNAHAEDLYWRASQLYRGQFLPDLDRDWIVALREDFEQLYQEALTGLAKCAQARQDFSQAVVYYQDAIHKAPYDEELYQGLMSCYAKLGDRARVSKSYTRLCTTFREDLALQPSKYSIRLFEQSMRQ